MENLNKENFWDALYSKYPSAVKEFCEWVDKYKAANNWDALFNGQLLLHPSHPSDIQTVAPKFHDLPLAMQMGIWVQFTQERGGCTYEVDLFTYDLREEITGFMKMIQEEHNMILED